MCLKNNKDALKGDRSQPQRDPTGQIWDSLSIRINTQKCSNLQSKINIQAQGRIGLEGLIHKVLLILRKHWVMTFQ